MHVPALWLVLGRTHGREEAGWGATGARRLSCKVSRAWRGGWSSQGDPGRPSPQPCGGHPRGAVEARVLRPTSPREGAGVAAVTQDRGHGDMAQAMLLSPTSAGDSGPGGSLLSCKAPGGGGGARSSRIPRRRQLQVRVLILLRHEAELRFPALVCPRPLGHPVPPECRPGWAGRSRARGLGLEGGAGVPLWPGCWQLVSSAPAQISSN